MGGKGKMYGRNYNCSKQRCDPQNIPKKTPEEPKEDKKNIIQLSSYSEEHMAMLFHLNPMKDINNKKKIIKFFKQEGHITMEKADSKNITKWFEACKEKGFLESMDFHREGVRGVFGMENYDKWRKGLSTDPLC